MFANLTISQADTLPCYIQCATESKGKRSGLHYRNHTWDILFKKKKKKRDSQRARRKKQTVEEIHAEMAVRIHLGCVDTALTEFKILIFHSLCYLYII